jgi:hypothetical protein
MQNKIISTLCLALFCLAVSGWTHAGKIVLANDEWTLSNTGFSQNANTSIFTNNVTDWFTGGVNGSFLAYSSNFGLTESSLANTMTSAGHSWTVDAGVTFDLLTLQAYDGVFLAGNPADNQVLIDYVNGGGNVYLAGGTGWNGGSLNEANQWNTFLNSFGLGFGTFYNGVAGNIPTPSSHAIFNGVNSLYQNNGNNAIDIDITDPSAAVLVSLNGHGLYAVYEGAASVAEPAPLALLLAGLCALFIRRKMA